MKSFYKKLFIMPICGLTIFLSFSITGCKKWLDIGAPPAQINSDNVFTQDNTAIAVLTGIYTELQTRTGYTGIERNVSILAGLSSDELSLYGGVNNNILIAHHSNQLTTAERSSSQGGILWEWYYNLIFRCNAAIEGITEAKTLTPFVKQQLLGEARFMRAFSYFYLINLYGDAPLVLSTDPEVNTALPRVSKEIIYEQIVIDLKEAQALLSPNYLDGKLSQYISNAEKLRPTKWVATALLARTYLYTRNYAAAEAESTSIIEAKSGTTNLFELLPLKDVFLKNSKEAIWQLQPIRTGRNTELAFLFNLPTTGPSDINTTTQVGNPVYLPLSLWNRFEVADLRNKSGNWVGSVTVGGITYYFPTKYKATTGVVTEYTMVLRLAEQYLIRAEARTHLGKLTGSNSAAADLDIIRQRAGLLAVTANSKEQLLDAILKERSLELFTEWGHRWLDIKRTGKVDEVMKAVESEKKIIWQSFKQLYPLPFDDIQRSPVLKQNPGYQ